MSAADETRALSLIQNFGSTDELDDIKSCIPYFQRYATDLHSSLPGDQKFNASLLWLLAAQKHQDESLLSAYRHIVEFLERLPALGLDLWARKQLLDRLPEDFATSAARQGILHGDLELAVTLLDKSRGLTWGQVLRTVPPTKEMERLMDSHPELGVPLRGYLNALLRGSMTPRAESRRDDQRITQQEIDAHIEIAQEAEDLLNRARQMPGFEHFMVPDPLRNARRLADRGPVVILVPDEACTHIILLREPTASLEHLVSERLTLENVRNMAGKLRRLLGRSGRSARGVEPADGNDPGDAQSDLAKLDAAGDSTERKLLFAMGNRKASNQILDDGLNGILSTLWRTLGVMIRDALSLTRGASQSPKVYLYPTGPLTSLPVHAMGDHAQGEALQDYLIPSYIPTLQNLAFPSSETQGPPHVLVISQPNTPGHSPLPATQSEVAAIREHVPPSQISVANGKEGVRQALMSTPYELSQRNSLILHLACHAHQEDSDPFRSAFYLYDGPVTMAQLLFYQNEGALLAVLSACETAAGDGLRPDETLHIGAAIQCFKGFPSVVATLWPIRDEDGPTLAKILYKELFASGATRMDPAAALRTAVNAMRNDKVELARWVPFIHFGV